MKAINLNLPPVELRRGMVVLGVAAALVIWVATAPRFLHPRHPAPPSLFTACLYVALAGLASFSVTTPRGLRILVWTPAITHLSLVAFATYSFFRRGHWPWYSMPDPKELQTPLFYGAVVIAVLVGHLAIPAGALALTVTACADEWRKRRTGLIHSAVALVFGAWLWLFEWRDRRLIEWLAD